MINIQYVHIYICMYTIYIYTYTLCIRCTYGISLISCIYTAACVWCNINSCLYVKTCPCDPMGKHRSVKDLLSDMVLGFQDFKIWTVELSPLVKYAWLWIKLKMWNNVKNKHMWFFSGIRHTLVIPWTSAEGHRRADLAYETAACHWQCQGSRWHCAKLARAASLMEAVGGLSLSART